MAAGNVARRVKNNMFYIPIYLSLQLNPIPTDVAENPYHNQGGPRAPPPCISGTLIHRMTQLGRNTHLSINSFYKTLNGLKINSY